jgi:hypothetical protein
LFTDAAKELITLFKTEVLQKAQSELSVRRDDNLEYCAVRVVFRWCRRSQDVHLQQTGALHKARWMAKLLYSIKICLLEQHTAKLPPSTITTTCQVAKIQDFVNFATLIYSASWMLCKSAVDASWHDLKLIHNLLAYEAVNSAVAKSALRAFKLHFWYLTAEMVPLALFSELVPTAERRALADKLLTVKPVTAPLKPAPRCGTGFR